MKFCCLPFLLVLTIFIGFLAAPRGVDVVLAEDNFKASFDPDSRYFIYQQNMISFDVLAMKVMFQSRCVCAPVCVGESELVMANSPPSSPPSSGCP